jgi:hypothetical protein
MDKHTKETYPNHPHEICCEACRQGNICNYCGSPTKKINRCTNGRCPQCCAKNCKHVTQG